MGTAFLLAALVAARSTSAWIASAFPDRPLPPDLLFETLPYVPKAGYVADFAVVAALALALAYAFRGNRHELPTMMTLFGMMQFTRALMNVLTPLASPLNHGPYYGISVELERVLRDVLHPLTGALKDGTYYGISVSKGVMHASQNGEFPSGHMASVLLCMLFVDRAKSPKLRAAVAVLVVAEFFSLLVSHQHYSIDIVGGLLLSYFIYHAYHEGAWFNWLKRLVKV